MKSRRSILVLATVLALMLSVISVASADGPRTQVAKFEAFAPLQFVGPAELIGPDVTSTTLLDIKTRKSARRADALGEVRAVVVETVNEGVIAAPTFVTDCGRNPGSAACGATASLLNNAANISLHTSVARLSKVTTDSTPAAFLPPALTGFWAALGIPPELAGSLDTYAGNLRGRLDSTFTILGGTGDVLVGSARLNINRGGEAVYGCFTDNPAFVPGGPEPPYLPLPGILFCSDDSPLPPVVRTLFLPTFLDIVDTGRFRVVPPPGSDVVLDPTTLAPVVVDGLTLRRLAGKLEVRVLALNGELLEPVPDGLTNKIDIDPGKAVWLSDGAVPHGAEDDDVEDDDGDDEDDD